MSVSVIPSQANQVFALLPCLPYFTVGLNPALDHKMGQRAEVANQEAIKILKQITWKSAILCAITKPIVLISFSISVVCSSFAIPPVGVALMGLRVTLAAISGGLLGWSIENCLNGFIPQMSNAYKTQCLDARRYIQILEQNPQSKLERKTGGGFNIVMP